MSQCGSACTRAHQSLTASTPLGSLPNGVVEYFAAYPHHSIAKPLLDMSGAMAQAMPYGQSWNHVTPSVYGSSHGRGQFWQYMAWMMMSLPVCTMSALCHWTLHSLWTLEVHVRALRVTMQRVYTKPLLKATTQRVEKCECQRMQQA